ncbi:uncharacterized protein TNCV_1913091 [Trichonephila clavipes]|nr:uncharacterized protein TNCV_1913091 [Trichonephila clavipes]
MSRDGRSVNLLRNQYAEKPPLIAITALIRMDMKSNRDWKTRVSRLKRRRGFIPVEEYGVFFVQVSTGDLVENTVEVEDKLHEEEDNGESEELVEDLDKAFDLEFESGVGTGALFHVPYAEKNSITNIYETIKKIKNVVKLFRKSPFKNELIDIKEEQMMINVEFETVTTIVKGLKPVKIGLEKLYSRNATLLTTEGVFSFVIGELNERNSEFAKKYEIFSNPKN